MSGKNDEAYPNEDSETERDADHQASNRGNIVSGTFHDLFDRSWIQNLVIGIAILAISPLVVYLFMRSVRGMLVGFGIGITILFWIFWLALIQRVAPKRAIPPNELNNAPLTALNVPNAASSPRESPVPTETPQVKATPTGTPSATALVTLTPAPIAPATPAPTPEVKLDTPYVSEMTPKEVGRKLQEAKKNGTSKQIREALVNMPVDWKLLFWQAEYTSDKTQVSAFFIWRGSADATTTDLMASFELPIKGHERLPLRDKYFEFRVEGIIDEVSGLDVVHLKEVRITPNQ